MMFLAKYLRSIPFLTRIISKNKISLAVLV